MTVVQGNIFFVGWDILLILSMTLRAPYFFYFFFPGHGALYLATAYPSRHSEEQRLADKRNGRKVLRSQQLALFVCFSTERQEREKEHVRV